MSPDSQPRTMILAQVCISPPAGGAGGLVMATPVLSALPVLATLRPSSIAGALVMFVDTQSVLLDTLYLVPQRLISTTCVSCCTCAESWRGYLTLAGSLM